MAMDTEAEVDLAAQCRSPQSAGIWGLAHWVATTPPSPTMDMNFFPSLIRQLEYHRKPICASALSSESQAESRVSRISSHGTHGGPVIAPCVRPSSHPTRTIYQHRSPLDHFLSACASLKGSLMAKNRHGSGGARKKQTKKKRCTSFK